MERIRIRRSRFVEPLFSCPQNFSLVPQRKNTLKHNDKSVGIRNSYIFLVNYVQFSFFSLLLFQNHWCVCVSE